MAEKNVNTTQGRINANLFQSVKGKFLLMGIMGIIASLVIGLIGMTSINQNAKSSDIVSLVNEINLLQSVNMANDAQYQYYIDEKYLNSTLENLQKMETSGTTLKKKAGLSYSSEVNEILSNVEKDKENYAQLLSIHSSRGYSSEIGKFAEYLNSSEPLYESFSSLINNNTWIEIPWTMASMGAGEVVDIDGKSYVKHVYYKTLPEVGKRDSLIFRIGGTFTYQADYYIKNIYLCNGSEEVLVDLSEREIPKNLVMD